MPGKGDRATTGPGVAWGASTRLRAHEGPHERHGSTQGIGTRATSEATRDGQGGSLSGASYLRRWGTEAHGTHGREGDAGHHVKLESKTGETLRAPTVTPQRQCMAAQAAHEADRVCPTWAHRIDADVLREAYRHTHTSSAAGIDGVTAKPYAAHLAEHLRDLHERLRRGGSQAPPVERVWREKDDGGQRPMGKPTCEDKMVQRAVARRLAAIYEQDFQDSSYGFRRGRSPHEARHERRERCLTEGIGWLVEAEVSGDFESREQTWVRDMRRTRVNDGSIVRLMGKWLHAGVMEEGGLTHPETGVPQGGVRTPPTKLPTFFFGVRIARVRIDPKHDMHLVGGHFHPLHQGTDQCAFACPVCLLSSMMYRSGKVLQATNNQLQFAMLGGFIRQLATLLIDLRDTAAHTEDAWCKRVLVNEALGVTVDQARQTLPQLAKVRLDGVEGGAPCARV